MMKPAHARLHVLLAREARLGLVIRHGTAKSVCTLLWDRKKDTFTLGQWMRGRVDIETCDLSPDGEHFLYEASKYVSRTSEIRGWTAVSRTPYLKAVAYYPRRRAGWFVNNRDYLAPGAPDPEDRESPEVRRAEPEDVPPDFQYANRLLRGGWVWAGDDSRETEFVRPAGSGWDLRHGPRRGYRLNSGDLTVDTRGWDWADVDGKRLVWTVKGCLWAGLVRKDGIHQEQRLHDFNGMKFEALVAPYEGGQKGRVLPMPTSPPVSTGLRKAPPRGPVRKKPDRSKVRSEEDEG
jgi:hypothetical protein